MRDHEPNAETTTETGASQASRPKRDPLLPKVIRSTAVVLDAADRERRLLELTSQATHARANEWSLVLLAMLGREVRVYNPDRPASDPYDRCDAAHWDDLLVKYTGAYTAEQRESLRAVAGGILSATNRKGFLYRLRQEPPKKTPPTGRKPPKGGPLQTAMTKLAAGGLLPLRNLAAFDKSLDLTAWSVATGGLASWIDQDNKTRANFAEACAKVARLAPNEKDREALAKFMRDTGTAETDLTERLCDKIKRFEFDVHGWEEELAVAQAIRKAPTFWGKVFEWSWQRRRLERLRPNATVRLPDARHSRRMMSFSGNHVRFRVSLDGDRLVFQTRLWDGDKMVPVSLVGKPTGYFRDLKVTEVKSPSNYYARFSYRRGNGSALPEEVTADLKVIRLLPVDGEFRVYLPLSYSQPQSAAGMTARDRYYNEPTGPTGLPEGLRILAADMGVNLFWAARCAEVRGGVAVLQDRVAIGGVKDDAYNKAIGKLAKRMWACKQLIDFRKFLAPKKADGSQTVTQGDAASGAGDIAFKTELGRRRDLKNREGCEQLRGDGIDHDTFRDGTDADRRTAIQVVVSRIIREYDQLKRYDLYPARQCGVCLELFTWLKATKLLHSLLKKWSYYNRKPAELGERRPGFEVRDRYLGNLKRDGLKKIAQACVADARRLRADVIVIEDLEFGRKGALDNEFLDLWAPATIRQWVQHFAVQYGIWVVAVNPAHTSQIDPQTGEWGYRSKFDRKYLWVLRDDKLAQIHCDLDSAAVNILNRFADRARFVFKMSVRPVAEQADCYVPVLRATADAPKDKGWARSELAHHLTRLYGTEWVVIRSGVAQPVTADEFRAIQTDGKAVDLYRRGDRWITPAERKALVEDIRRRCGESPTDVNKIKPAKLPPKPTRSRKVKQKVAA